MVVPHNCSAPGCRSNYNLTERIPVFKMPEKPDELKHAWLRSVYRDDIDELKVVYVCSKLFRRMKSKQHTKCLMETEVIEKYYEAVLS